MRRRRCQWGSSSMLDLAIAFLARIGRVLDRFEVTTAGLIAGVLVLTTGWGVFSRYFLGVALPWPEEIGIFLYIWMSYLGAAAITRRRKHIEIAFFVDSMSPFWRSVTTIFTHILMGIFFIIILKQAPLVLPAQLTIEIGAAIRLPKAYLTIVLFFACASMLLTVTQIILEEIRNISRGEYPKPRFPTVEV